jgi:ferredoxin
VGFYRLAGPANMLVAGALVLVVAVFVGRPYCRYVCPYGALLRPLASLSWRHATITPAECINCRLCEDACPYNAIQTPTPKESSLPVARGKGLLAAALAAVPLLVAGGGLAAGLLGGPLSRLDYTVRMEREAGLEEYLRSAEKLTHESPLLAGGMRFVLAESGGSAVIRAFDANDPGGGATRGGAAGQPKALWQSAAIAPASVLASRTAWRGLALSEDGGTVWALFRDHEIRPDASEDVCELIFLDARSGAVQRREQYRLDMNLVQRYRNTGRTAAALAGEVAASGGRFTWAGRIAGALLGLVLGLKLVHLSVRRRREFHQIDRARCVSCGRCFRYCPVPRGGVAATTKGTKVTKDTKT